MQEEKKFFDNFKGVMYAPIPISMYKNPTIRPIHRDLYTVINLLSISKGYCWASNEYLAAILNCTKKTIISTIKDLEEMNYIKKEQFTINNSNRRKLYTIENKIEEKIEENRQLFDYDWLNEE